MSGGAAVETVRPVDLAEARDAMRDAGRERALVIRGAGTKLDWGAPAHRHALIVETAGLDRLLAHDAADATAVVQAGMPLAVLQHELAGANQWLAVDPPHQGATVGGVFAANATGPRRLRFGTLRDLVIGMTLVTTDGTVARCGGQVIKNVAGYDLAKLLCGSLGTLGLVAELIVRLHPLPAASATVTAEVDPAVAVALAVRLLAAPLVLTALDWSQAGAEGDDVGVLAVRVEGRDAAVGEQARAVLGLLREHGVVAHTLVGDDEDVLWRRLAAGHVGDPGQTVAVASTMPSTFDTVAEAFAESCRRTGVTGELNSHLGNGLHTGRLLDGDAAAHAATVALWRREVAPLGGHVTVRCRHEDLVDPAVIWGPPPPAIDLMRAIKREFDPQGRCAPGRFVGGI